MGDPDRRLSARELGELVERVRRDPSSPAFLELSEAYLALGRPRDTLDVAAAGFALSPEFVEARVLMARAHAQLHQWKEAQSELLKVVKLDRGNREGFALLGEVLMRRSDFERAVPVLQHAQNLDPTSGHILQALRRARAGQHLDPPPPIPTPVDGAPAPGVRAPARVSEAPPTAAARPPAPRSGPTRPPPVRAPIAEMAPPSAPAEVARSAPSAATMIAAAPREPAARSAVPLEPTPMAQVLAPVVAPAPDRPAQPKSASPVGSPVGSNGEVIRPRIISQDRPQNVAQDSLRRSAAVGEGYLNALLTNGLFHADGVRVADVDYDLKPDHRWGRSTRRMFIVLFAVAVLGIGGGTGWWWWSGKQRDEAVAKLQAKSQVELASASFDGINASLTSLKAALDKQRDNPLTFAYVAEAAGLDALLYGGDTSRVSESVRGATPSINKPTQKGFRELLIGDVASQLSQLGTLEAPAAALTDINKRLDEWLAAHDDDALVRFLKARALLAGGQRTAAIAQLKDAAKPGANGPLLIALIERADLLLDDGKVAEATALYDEVLAVEKDHPLALVGRALARAESASDASSAIDDLSVKLDKPLGPRVAAYRQLALALAKVALDDYGGFAEALSRAQGTTDARFLNRLALAQIRRGDLAAAAEAFAGVTSFGTTKPEPDPLAIQVNMGLLLASGLPEKALELSGSLEGMRVHMMRAQALLDLDRPKEAQAEADAALAIAPELLEAQLLREFAQVIISTGSDRVAALENLEKLGRRAKSRLGRHTTGMAQLAIGNLDDAKKRLTQATEDISDESPNPLLYRTQAALAQVLLAQGDIVGASAAIEASIKANSGYLPARVLQAQLMLKQGKATEALAMLAPVVNEGALTPVAELAYAEALAARTDATADDLKAAKEIVSRLTKESKLPITELGRVASIIDSELPTTLGLPVQEGAAVVDGVESPPPSGTSSRRRRR